MFDPIVKKMIKSRTIVNKNTVHKTYQENCLLDSSEDIYNRIKKINSLEYDKFCSLVKTNIVKNKNIYDYTQNYVEQKKFVNITKSQIGDLSSALEHLSSVSLVHGDLNRKNIIYSKNGFKIIDLEPSLKQIIDGTPKFMITKPYISKNDLKQNNISTRTDKLCFFYFVLRIKNKIQIPDLIKLSKSLNHRPILKFDEAELDNLTYEDVLSIAWNYNAG